MSALGSSGTRTLVLAFLLVPVPVVLVLVLRLGQSGVWGNHAFREIRNVQRVLY